MPTLKTSGARIALAGTAAAALTLAAGSPAFAQETEIDGFQADLTIAGNVFEPDSFDTHSVADENPEPAHMEVRFDPEEADRIQKLHVGFEFGHHSEEAVELYTDDPSCTAERVYVFCTVENDGSGIFDSGEFGFDFAIGPDVETVPDSGYPYTYEAVITTVDEKYAFSGHMGSVSFTESALADDDGEEDPTDEPTDGTGDDGDLDVPEIPGQQLTDAYSFAYLDHTVTGADVGSTVAAAPQIQVEESPDETRAATVVWFTDAVDAEKWSDPDVAYDGYEMDADSASVVDSYDNCEKWDIWLVCFVTDWTAEQGKTYEPSESTPVNYEIEGEVAESDIAVYSAFDIDQDRLDWYLEDWDVDLSGGDQFALAEVSDSEIAPADSFYYREGWISFAGSIKEIADTSGDEQALPETGSSMTIVLTSALGAIAVGAVVFFVLRRRKTAENWG